MVEAGAIEDYTYLVGRPAPPEPGTVETRSSTSRRGSTTPSRSRSDTALAHRLAHHFDEGEPLVEVPTELVDDNKVRAALRGMEGKLVDSAPRASRRRR